MKRKWIIATAALSMAFASAVVLVNANPLLVSAATDDKYYIIGNTNDIGWNLDTKDIEIVDGGASVPVTFKAGDNFKLIKNGGWDGQINENNVKGTATGYFSYGTSGGNIYCNVGGQYDVSVKDGAVYFNLRNPSTAKVYVQLKDWASTYLYMFDETTEAGEKLESLGAWPGTSISDYTVSTNFKGSEGGIGVIEVPYVNLANTRIILNNNNDAQSPNYPLANNYFYWKWSGEGVGYLADGQAAKVVYDFDKYYGVNQFTCSTPSAKAAELWNEYAALDANPRSAASSSVITNSNLTVGAVAAELFKIASKAGETVTILEGIQIDATPKSDNESPVLAITIIGLGFAAVTASAFFLRKRKEQ